MKTIMYNGHKIEVQVWGTEKVLYDGVLMSSKRAMLGATHTFTAFEDGEEVVYEVENGLGSILPPTPYTTVRRMGILFFSDR